MATQPNNKTEHPTSKRGVGVDASGGPVVDPTANVIALNEAAVQRQDDLRQASEDLTKARFEHMKELLTAESRRINEQLALRAEYTERLSVAEAKRIDAIRAVDVNAVAVASQRASDQATVLATQVAQSAEALRGLVASTANTVAQSQQQLATTLSTRITTLEQAQYEGKGKQAYVDPMMAEMVAQMKKMSEAQASGTGKSEGVSGSVAMIFAVIGMLGVLFGIFMALKK
jgi:hypothetical protein